MASALAFVCDVSVLLCPIDGKHCPYTCLLCPATAQALQRVAALDRCLSVPSGAVLLVGPAGSGRRSLAQLMAHAHGMRWWSPRISR
jgi:hypothetical protein